MGNCGPKLASNLGPRAEPSRAALRRLRGYCVSVHPDAMKVHLPSRPERRCTDAEPRRESVLAEARRLGFSAVGVGGVEAWPCAAEQLAAWLDAGFAGDMEYMGDGARADPRSLHPGAKSFVAVALSYPRAADLAVPRRSATDHSATLAGHVARYARGQDYHVAIKGKLMQLADHVADCFGAAVRVRICVDTAPLLEREAARRAGLGFIGKSTMLIIPGLGTNFLIGVMLMDVHLEPSEPADGSCGACTACLDACPTNAFPAPYCIDGRRCVSYLTIENSGEIPPDLRGGIGNRVFGCDVCQDICPYNASAEPQPFAPELAPEPARADTDLVALLEQTSGDHRRRVKRSAMRRAGRHQLKRNAAVALGNSGQLRAVPALSRSLASDGSPLVRGHAAWALGRLGGPVAEQCLLEAERSDADPGVRAEARSALLTLRESRR